jgi:hypothetical protein
VALKLWLELKDAGGISGSKKKKERNFGGCTFCFVFFGF